MNAMKTTVIKNGKDISNTDEGKNIAEKIKELEKKVEELSAKLEEKNIEDQKKDEQEINESKKDVEITEGPVLEQPALKEQKDDEKQTKTGEDKDDELVMPRPIKWQLVQEKKPQDEKNNQKEVTEQMIEQGQALVDKEKITEKQMAKELIKQGKKLLSNNPSSPINEEVNTNKELVNEVSKSLQLSWSWL